MSSLQRQYLKPFIRATQPFRTTATQTRYYRTRTSHTMDHKFQEGQKVEYHPIGGSYLFLRTICIQRGLCGINPFSLGSSGTSTSTGKIVRVLTEPDAAGSTGVTVKASESDPRYEVHQACVIRHMFFFFFR